jgi:hypothetical protein
MFNLFKLWFFPVALFGYGLVATFITSADLSRQLTVPYRAIVLVSSVIMLGVGLWQGTKFSRRYVGVLLCTLMFAILYSARLVYDVTFNSQLVQLSGDYVLPWFGISLVPAFGFFLLNLKDPLKYLNISWYLLIAIAFRIVLGNLQTGRTFSQMGRLGGEALNPISVGNYATSLVLLSLLIFLNRDPKGKNSGLLTTGLVLVAISLGMYLLLLSASRGPILALVFCSTLLFLGARNGQRGGIDIKKFLVMLVIPLVFALASSLALGEGSSYLDRFLNSEEEIGGAGAGIQRPQLYPIALGHIWNNLILGTSIEVPGIGYPHNLILESFLATGVIGGFLFTFIYFKMMHQAIRLVRTGNAWNWLGILFVQYGISAMLSGSLYASSFFWCLLAALLGLKEQFAPAAHPDWSVDVMELETSPRGERL